MKNSSSPDLVANVVLNAVKDENPNLRYLAGNDVEQWLGAKRNMSDEEFYKMMTKISHNIDNAYNVVRILPYYLEYAKPGYKFLLSYKYDRGDDATI